MSETPEPKRVVIRASTPGASTREDAAGPRSASPTPDPPGRPEAESSTGSGPGTPSPRASATPPLGLPLTILGGLLMCFGPLLPWWRSTGSVIAGTQIGGLSSWMGIVALISGAATVSLDAAMLSSPKRDLRVPLLVAAFVGAAASIAALVAGRGLMGFAIDISPQVGLLVTVAGGVVAAAGSTSLMLSSDPP